MKTCPNCHAQVEDNVKFCENCGAKIPETVFCPQCGQPTSTEFAFCQNCGASIAVETAPAAAAATAAAAPAAIAVHRKFPLKVLLIVLAAAVVLAGLVFGAIKLFGGSSSDEKRKDVLYLKDGELNFSMLSKAKPVEITSDMGIGDISQQNSYSLSWLICMTPDGKGIFYPDKMDSAYSGDNFTLYYRTIGGKDDSGVKVASNVFRYNVSSDGKKVYYLTWNGDTTDLYVTDMKDKEKLASEVSYYYLGKNDKRIVWVTSDNVLYSKTGTADKEKVDSDVASLYTAGDEMDTLYYIKDNTLYRKKGTADKEKLVEDVSYISNVGENGEVYYVTEQDEEKSLLDYVDDDMKDSDSAMQEPVYDQMVPAYPWRFDYDSDDAYNAAMDAYNTASQAYQDALDAWWDKQDRDYMRSNLQNQSYPLTVYTLNYFDGKGNSTVLTEGFQYIYTYDFNGDDNGAFVYGANTFSPEDNKVKLSEVTSVNDVSEMLNKAMYSASVAYFCIGGKTSQINGVSEIAYPVISPDGKYVYYLQDYDYSKASGDLYRAAISGGTVGTPELYAEDVGSYRVSKNGSVFYIADLDEDNMEGDLYFNKEMIASDVYGATYSTTNAFINDTDVFTFMTDYNSDDYTYTLNLCDGKNSTEIAEDVIETNTIDEKCIVYLGDYSANRSKGDLYLYNGGKKPVTLDTDVAALLTDYDSDMERGVSDY